MDANNLNNIKPLNLSGMVPAKNKTISGDRFYVGEGILRCDNYFISLDSVCMVEVVRRQISMSAVIIFMVFGVLAGILLMSAGALVGILVIVLVIALGVFILFLIGKLNEKIPYSLTVRLSNNASCTYNSLNKKFIEDVMDVIQSCINDRRGGYNILLNQGKIERNTITNNGGKFNYAADNATINDSSREENVINNNNGAGLTAAEWMNLEKYFIMRQQEFSTSDENYKICGDLAAYSQRKDANKIKKYLQTLGKEALRMLFAASTNVVAMEAVKPIIIKLLSLKG